MKPKWLTKDSLSTTLRFLYAGFLGLYVALFCHSMLVWAKDSNWAVYILTLLGCIVVQALWAWFMAVMFVHRVHTCHVLNKEEPHD